VKVVLLSGGGGGASFARGLDAALAPGELTVVGNVGDDLEVLGLHVSPDLDSLLYTLGDLIDSERGWGRADETWNALESVASWGGEDWFRLGDRDLGLHLVRTSALREGASLSKVTAELSGRVRLRSRILPATNGRLRTHVVTPAGRFPFQEWFVGRAYRDEVDRVEYEGADHVRAAPGVVEAVAGAEAILLAPSNPFLSIGPILAVAEIRAAIEQRRTRCVAVSPLIGGEAVTGPLGRMLTRMAGGTSPAHVTQSHKGLLDVLVIDEADASSELPADVQVVVTKTLMHDRESERRLAEVVLEAACG
jgi:LPPG:FO 2-phospho-L-lactate transferase